MHRMQPTGLSRSKGRAISNFLPLVLTLILFTSFAFASPPDSSWIA